MAKLSKTMTEALLHGSLRPRPYSVHDYERESERWLRGVPQRTCEALVKRGLVDEHWYDPIGHRRAHLTDLGVRTRQALRDERKDHRAAIRALISR